MFVHIAQGHSIALAQCMAEGYVVRPVPSRTLRRAGRMVLEVNLLQIPALGCGSIQSPLSFPKMKVTDMEGQPHPRRWL